MNPATRPPDLYAVLGNPVAHSQSPFIHAAFAAQTGEAIEYRRVLCPLDGFEAAVRAFAAAGGRGVNVTVPFKFDAPRLAAQVSERAALAGAANVLRLDADGWQADNTDGIGLLHDIEHNAGCRVRGLRVLLIGAGGAGAGVLGPLLGAAPAAVTVANRGVERAQALVTHHAPAARAAGAQLVAAPLHDCGSGHDLVINASASSLHGGAVPVGAQVLHPGSLYVDLMYGPAGAPGLRWAEAQGARTRDGLGMLVEQAAEAFVFWRGLRPQTAPVLAALRAHLAAPAAQHAPSAQGVA